MIRRDTELDAPGRRIAAIGPAAATGVLVRPPLQRLALLVGQHHRTHRTAPFLHPSSLQLINQLLAQDTRSG
jgi:hypothetical protein